MAFISVDNRLNPTPFLKGTNTCIADLKCYFETGFIVFIFRWICSLSFQNYLTLWIYSQDSCSASKLVKYDKDSALYWEEWNTNKAGSWIMAMEWKRSSLWSLESDNPPPKYHINVYYQHSIGRLFSCSWVSTLLYKDDRSLVFADTHFKETLREPERLNEVLFLVNIKVLFPDFVWRVCRKF